MRIHRNCLKQNVYGTGNRQINVAYRFPFSDNLFPSTNRGHTDRLSINIIVPRSSCPVTWVYTVQISVACDNANNAKVAYFLIPVGSSHIPFLIYL